jgi:hypothetical protein
MKKSNPAPEDKWYNRFVKNSSTGKKETHPGKRTQAKSARNSSNMHSSISNDPARIKTGPLSDARIVTTAHLFEAAAVPKDAREVLNTFPSIVQGVFPASGKQLLSLPLDIRRLSHELTDERSERRTSYMNSPAYLSAYVRYFMWWNLVRLTRLFANLGSRSFPVQDGDYCLDIGSGPLTVVTALWLACPELRNKKITWYCMDISQGALSLGEDLYLSIAARTPPGEKGAEPHWNIIRIKGALGVTIREKASLITCTNMFNELYQNGQYAPEDLAQKYAASLFSYTAEKHTILVVEPGVPRQARIISLLRDSFIKSNMKITAPCPHVETCAMNGLHARMGGTAKWCNFAFSTEDAPQQLLKLSADSGIPKERAVLSFVLASNAGPETKQLKQTPLQPPLTLRIASDPIRLPGHRTGYYACSQLGLTLAINASGTGFKSGDSITVIPLNGLSTLHSDVKTGAKELSIGK